MNSPGKSISSAQQCGICTFHDAYLYARLILQSYAAEAFGPRLRLGTFDVTLMLINLVRLQW